MFSVEVEFMNKKSGKEFLPLFFFPFQGNVLLKAECVIISAYFSTFFFWCIYIFYALREGECVCRLGVYVLLLIWCVDCCCLIKEGEHRFMEPQAR